MQWNDHSKLKGSHALLAPSAPSWLNYGTEDLEKKLISSYATSLGTSLHEFAEDLIKLKIKLEDNDAKMVLVELLRCEIPRYAIDMDRLFPNFKQYVNDAISYDMDPEILLYVSDYAFGTADAIMFDGNHLQIHDLKTGVGATHIEQLRIYAALFCLEYGIAPGDISIEVRIYQNGDIYIDRPTPSELLPIMDTIIQYSDILVKKNGGNDSWKMTLNMWQQ